MRYKRFTILSLFALTTILYAGAIIQSFEAQSNGDNIVLTWQSADEQNVSHYEKTTIVINPCFAIFM